MNTLRDLLARHIQTSIRRAADHFPGAFIVALKEEGPALVVYGPESLKIPETYEFAVDGAVHSVPIVHWVQKGIDEEMKARITGKKAQSQDDEPKQQAA